MNKDAEIVMLREKLEVARQFLLHVMPPHDPSEHKDFHPDCNDCLAICFCDDVEKILKDSKSYAEIYEETIWKDGATTALRAAKAVITEYMRGRL